MYLGLLLLQALWCISGPVGNVQCLVLQMHVLQRSFSQLKEGLSFLSAYLCSVVSDRQLKVVVVFKDQVRVAHHRISCVYK